MEDYAELNRASWDERAPAHAASPGYGVDRFGTDTISLARLGATMTGLDFSPTSIEQARRIAGLAGADVRFVQAEVYDALTVLEPASFDLVYTGIGALCWLPDIARWAGVVAGLLRPGGRLFLREGHPVLWAVDDRRDDDLLVLEYPYVERPEPLAHGAQAVACHLYDTKITDDAA